MFVELLVEEITITYFPSAVESLLSDLDLEAIPPI